MKKSIAKLLIICVLAGTMAWGTVSRESKADSGDTVIGAFGTQYICPPCLYIQ